MLNKYKVQKALIGLGLLALLVVTARLANRVERKMRCYIHRVDGQEDHPSKIKTTLDFGYVVQCKSSRYDHVEMIEHYVLEQDFDKEYKVADCYMWDSTQEPAPVKQ